MDALRTPLYDWHVAHKARMVPFTGYALPVQYTEKTGGDATAYLKFGTSLVATRVDPERIGQFKQGDTIQIAFPQRKVHLFDAASGRRL